jgi:uroporphyrinogen-III synthase
VCRNPAGAVRLIVTRPAAQAGPLLAALQALGVDAQPLPLVEIAPPPDPAAVQAAWAALPQQALAMFVSANAVEQFFALRPEALAPWPAGVRAAAPGPGTAAALAAAGVPAAAVVTPPVAAGRFDSEALWALLASEPWAGRRVLVVRGGSDDAPARPGTPAAQAQVPDPAEGVGREWLADRWRAAGARVDYVVAYRRLAPRPQGAAAALLVQALAAPAAHAWLFGSSEAVQRLQELVAEWVAERVAERVAVPGAHGVAGLAGGGGPFAAALALVPHERIAAAAREAGFGRVLRCAADAPAVARALQAALAEGAGPGPKPDPYTPRRP